MKSTVVSLSFPNNPSRVFYSGQTLSGLVVIELSKPKTVKGVYVKIVGRAYCRWGSGGVLTSSSNIGEELYLLEKTFFVGDASRRGNIVLAPKRYILTTSAAYCPILYRLRRKDTPAVDTSRESGRNK